jgi:methyltransferase (TIGR00027 family)
MRDGEASATARRVAAHRLRCPRVPTTFGRPGDDVALATDVAGDAAIREGRLHRYLCRRTSFFDRVVVDAIAAGVRQVVIVGAGYDGRAMRFAHPNVTWFEVDHPATQTDKLARLARLGLSTEGTAYIGIDLRSDPLVARLFGAGLDDAAATLFVLEGLVAYLSEPVLAATLGALRAAAAAGSQLAASVGRSRSGGTREDEARAAALREAVAQLGEPIRNELGAAAFAVVCERAGWRRTRRGVEDDPGAEGLGFVVAAAEGG